MKGLGVAIATNPLFWAAGAALGIYATVKAIDYFTVSVEEARETAIDAASELDELESSIDSINSELKTSASRIDELNDKPNLTFIEQEELQNLKDTTAELERQFELKMQCKMLPKQMREILLLNTLIKRFLSKIRWLGHVTG